LSIGNNILGDKGMYYLSQGLKNNETLSKLSLSKLHNNKIANGCKNSRKIGNEGAKYLADMFLDNENLKLKLRHLDLSKKGY
jgi:hypothetical protein